MDVKHRGDPLSTDYTIAVHTFHRRAAGPPATLRERRRGSERRDATPAPHAFTVEFGKTTERRPSARVCG